MLELELKDISKIYDKKTAVNRVNASFTHGVYGLLGANGAGKTTLMRMMCDVLRPDHGSIVCQGVEIGVLGAQYRKILGYLPQDFGYYPDFTARKFLRYLAELKALDHGRADARIRELLDMVGLSEEANKKIKTFSGGMIRRLGIAQAMLNDPEILILDEPTSGLDPKERIRFRNIISAFSKDRIVLLSTHIVSDVDYIADEILLMKQGSLILKGSREEITRTVKGHVWECDVAPEEAQRMEALYTVSNLRNQDGRVAMRIITDRPPSDAARCAEPNMEDVYLYYFRKEQGG